MIRLLCAESTLLRKGKIDCRESGSTLRFLLPIAAALGTSCEFFGKGKLPSRPLRTYIDCFSDKSVSMQPESGMPFLLSGKLIPGQFSLSGNISSQFVTGLLFSASASGGGQPNPIDHPIRIGRLCQHDFGNTALSRN